MGQNFSLTGIRIYSQEDLSMHSQRCTSPINKASCSHSEACHEDLRDALNTKFGDSPKSHQELEPNISLLDEYSLSTKTFADHIESQFSDACINEEASSSHSHNKEYAYLLKKWHQSSMQDNFRTSEPHDVILGSNTKDLHSENDISLQASKDERSVNNAPNSYKLANSEYSFFSPSNEAGKSEWPLCFETTNLSHFIKNERKSSSSSGNYPLKTPESLNQTYPTLKSHPQMTPYRIYPRASPSPSTLNNASPLIFDDNTPTKVDYIRAPSFNMKKRLSLSNPLSKYVKDSPNCISYSQTLRTSTPFKEKTAVTPKIIYHGKNHLVSQISQESPTNESYNPSESTSDHSSVEERLKPEYEELLSKDSNYGFIDTHCHLDFLFSKKKFYGLSFKEYRTRCQGNERFPICFKGCVAIFCRPSTFKKVDWWDSILSEDGVWGAFGCHPHFVDSYGEEEEMELYKAMSHPKVVAFGEIGLDYSWKNDNSEQLQKKIFKSQLRIALEVKKPLVIHSRDASKDCLEILKEMVPSDYYIHRHCFTGNWREATEWMDAFPNLFLGLTCLVTYFDGASSVRDVARRLPLDRLLIETDAPYFRPKHIVGPGSLSHPGMGIFVAAEVAKLQNIDLCEVLMHARRNTAKMYGV